MKRLSIFVIAILLCVPCAFSQIFEEGFESGNTDEMPPTGWICDDAGWICGYQEKTRNRIPHSGEWYAYASYNTDKWMYKEVSLTEGSYYRVSFWHITDGIGSFSFEIKAGNAPQTQSMTTQVLAPMTINNNTYQQTSAVFQSAASGTQYIGFHSTADNSPWYLTVDDITFEETNIYNFNVEPLTPDTMSFFGEDVALRFAVTNTGLYDDVLSFTNSYGDLNAVFFINGSPVTQQSVAVNETVIVSAVVTIPLAGVSSGQTLTQNTVVSSTNSSIAEVVGFEIYVLAPFAMFPYETDFEEDVFPPYAWQNHAITGSYAFERAASGEQPVCVPHDNSTAMVIYKSFYSAAGNSAILVTPKLDFEETDNIVRFWMYRTDNISNKEDRINVWYSPTPTTESATLLGTVHRNILLTPYEESNDWYEYSYEFDCPDNYGFIIFEAISEYGWNMYLDDVYINNATSDIHAPTVVSLLGNSEYADTEMFLTLRLRDESEIPSVINATYTINGASQDIEFTAGKGDYFYYGSIPAQSNHTEGTIIFELEDVLGNSTTSDPYPISWHWQAPLLEEGFEGETFPPNGWSREGMPQTWLQWSRWGIIYYTDSDEVEYIVTPPEGVKQACLEWDFDGNTQDEHLMTPILSITRPTVLEFMTFAHYGQVWNDRFNVRIFDTSNATWEVVWEAADLPFGMNQYEEKVSIDLSNYIGKNIKIDWRGYNTDGTNLWYSWFIDDVLVIPTDTVATPYPILQFAALTGDTAIAINTCGDLRFSLSNTGNGNDEITIEQTEGNITGEIFIEGTNTNIVSLSAGETKYGYIRICIQATGYNVGEIVTTGLTAVSSTTGSSKYIDYDITVQQENGIETAETEVQVYPNPVCDILNIVAEDMEIESIELYGINGKLLYRNKLNCAAATIPTRSYAEGFYFIKIRTNKSSFVKTLQIKR